MKNYTKPFRVGRKQGRAVLDANGIEVVLFATGQEQLAQLTCKLLNEHKGLLDGRVAIQVNNEREFKLLMEHYEGRGWTSDILNESVKYEHSDYYNCYDYHDSYRRSDNHTQIQEGYKIIPFSDFAAEVGITVPVLIGESQDGVQMFIDDDYFKVLKVDGNMELLPLVYRFTTNDLGRMPKSPYLAFSTKEAAEAWVAEQNKPKEIIVSPNSTYPVYVSESGACIVCENSEKHKDNILLSPKEIKEIYNAHQEITKQN